MAPDKILKVIACLAALVAAVSWLIAGHQAAEAGHTLGQKHCRSSPRTCTYVYSADGDNLIASQKSFHVWNDRSTASIGDAGYEAALDGAEANWAVAAGPQNPVETGTTDPALPHMSQFFLTCIEQGDPLGRCAAGATAVACRADISLQVSCFNEAINTYYALIYVNDDIFQGLTDFHKRFLMAHEMGHSLGLADVTQVPCLMNNLTDAFDAPQPCDLGFADPIFSSPPIAPCDGSPDDYGIRCVFQWWREQSPALDCYDVNRDGTVDLFNDVFLAADAFGSMAGEPVYHPDADVDQSGVVDLFNDIIGISDQFGDVCEADHYPHS